MDCATEVRSAALRLAAAVLALSPSVRADIRDWGKGETPREKEASGREACGVISKFWNVGFAKAAMVEGEGANERHYELLTDEVLAKGIDWSKGREVSEGITVVCYKVEPSECVPKGVVNGETKSFGAKKQKFYLARVDLKTPGIRVTGAARCNRWGEPMTDVESEGYTCGTLRERATDFMARCRGDRADGGRAKDMRFAFNSCGWGPWSKAKDQSSAYGRPQAPLMFDGVRVDCRATKWDCGSHGAKGDPFNLLVIRKDGTAGFIESLTETAAKGISMCMPRWPCLLVRKGEACASVSAADAQRTNFGLSEDGRYFYVLVADGRNKAWASGPDYYECALVQKAMGSYAAISVDGGGSSTMVSWDGAASKPVMHNWQGAPRRVGCSCGFYICSVIRQDDTDYRDIDDYIGFGLEKGDVAEIVRSTAFAATNGFPKSCMVKGRSPDLTLGWGKGLEPTVLAGTRVCFTNLSFAADSRTLTVRKGGTAAIASDVLDKVVTADAAGFELAGALTADLTVECAGAKSVGRAFGTVSVAKPDAATLGHIRHPTDPALRAAVLGRRLVWRRSAAR